MKEESNTSQDIESLVKNAMKVYHDEYSESDQYPETSEFIKRFPPEIGETLIERIDIYQNFDIDALVQYMRESQYVCEHSQNDNEEFEAGYAKFRKRIPEITENVLRRIREIQAAARK